jgi:hypothetical protein
MAHVSDLIADRHRRLPEAARAQEPAALHHLRQRGRRQEHADRPPAVRIEDALRRPARRTRGRLEEGRHQGGDLDFALLVDGLPPSASRASRSTWPTASSRPTGASSSSPTRRATSSTRATWSPAPRRPTSPSSWSTRAGRADPDAPPQLPGEPDRHPQASWWSRSTRWIWSDYSQKGVFRPHRRGLPEFARQLGLEDILAIPMSALGRQHHRLRASACPGTTARR